VESIIMMLLFLLSAAASSMQGNVWVAHLPQGDWSKLTLKQASSKDKKKEKEALTKDASKREGLQDCLEIWPVRKHAILNSNVLYLRAADGTEESILLDGCEVLAVSSGHGPGGKWSVTILLSLSLSLSLISSGLVWSGLLFCFWYEHGYLCCLCFASNCIQDFSLES
jgi:hypothetical protein